MKYRPHRRLLIEAMAEVAEFTDLDGLIEAMMRGLSWYRGEGQPTRDNVTVEPYCFDGRIGWATHIVCVNGSVWGYTDGPVICHKFNRAVSSG
jgi:hypothetical protein